MQTGSESNNVLRSSQEGGGGVNTQTGSESNNVIESSQESRQEEKLGDQIPEDLKKSSQI